MFRAQHGKRHHAKTCVHEAVVALYLDRTDGFLRPAPQRRLRRNRKYGGPLGESSTKGGISERTARLQTHTFERTRRIAIPTGSRSPTWN